MHDPKVNLRHRIECAALLLKLNPEEFLVRTVRDPDAPVVVIRIEGLGTVSAELGAAVSQDETAPQAPRLN